MKKFVLMMLALFCVSGLYAQKKTATKYITIKGKVQFLNPPPYDRFNKIWIEKVSGWDTRIIDSTNISPDGSWQIKVKSPLPTFYTVDIAKWDRATIYTDSNATINSRGYDTAKYKMKNPPYVFVEGSQADNFINLVEHAVYRNYQNMIAIGQETYYASLSKDSSWSAYLKKKNLYGQLDEDFKDRLKVFIKVYKDKPVVIYALGMLNWEKDQAIIMPILKDLNKRYPWFKDADEMQKNIEDRIAHAKLLKPGKPIPVVNYPDSKGQLQSLGQYKGKYLLMDFWASWCGSCRAAIPKVKKLYEKYHKEGFDVVSISIDDTKKGLGRCIERRRNDMESVAKP